MQSIVEGVVCDGGEVHGTSGIDGQTIPWQYRFRCYLQKVIQDRRASMFHLEYNYLVAFCSSSADYVTFGVVTSKNVVMQSRLQKRKKGVLCICV